MLWITFVPNLSPGLNVECGDSSENAIRLYNHKKSHLPKLNPCLVCPECGKLCIGSTELKFHLYTHSGAKPYPCEICNKEFRTPSNLKTHKASHMIERKFFCKLCDKSFKLKQTLKKHELLHLEFSKPFTCGTCGSSFRETWNCTSRFIWWVNQFPAPLVISPLPQTPT